MGAEDLKPLQPVSDVPITHRQTVNHDPLAFCLDRLLQVSADIAPSATLDEAAHALLAVATELLPDAAIGVCIPSALGGQIVIRRSPRVSHLETPDPTKLFPEFAHERVISLPHDETSTLHIAADDEARLAANGPAELIIDRLSLALGAALRHCRAYERARHGEAEVRGLQAQVIQSEKLASLGQIAAGIVHELNNPLTSIVAYSDYLRKKAEKNGSDPADVERLLRINEAAERILRFSRDLIAYSRPSAEVPAPVAIHDIIDRALVFCEHVLDQTGVMVERNFGTVRPVRGVAGQLTQVFVNLFTNACHAMRENAGGCLTITTSMGADGHVCVVVTDDGHGIDADHLPRIFDPFFTTKTDGSGTGLGLSIVRNIVVGHGGRIRADGKAPRGTIFEVDLPVSGDPFADG
jgi:two-component system NtrC family sensor kinase